MATLRSDHVTGAAANVQVGGGQFVFEFVQTPPFLINHSKTLCMDPFKLTSLRISEKSLKRAERIAYSTKFWKTSEVLRLAISFGLLICEKYSFTKFYWHMHEYDVGLGHFDIDVKWVPND